jgi:exosortase A-associated hydrolase 2
MSDSASPQLFFLPRGDGQRLCVYHAAGESTPRGALVYIHPWAEEMNKSRRMAALQSRALAAAGYSVLQIDLKGCGDSSGDFGDATWDSWLDDIAIAVEWLTQRTDAPLWLWSLRAGCLLASQAAARLARPSAQLYWQPPTSGKAVLQQFLRLRVAGMLQGGSGKGVLNELRERLADGEAVDIAGYRLSANLAHALESATLAPRGIANRLEWIEVSSRDDMALSTASTDAAQAWRTAGWQVRTHLVNGPPFWQTTEIEVAPDLLSATVAAIDRETAPDPGNAAVRGLASTC